MINTDRIRNCIAESGDEAMAYHFRYLSLFGDFEHVGLHFSHNLPDAVYGRHPALIKNSARIINAKRATRFPTPYLHEPARALLDLLPTDRFQTSGPIKSLLNYIPGRPSSTLLHLPYHKRINMGVIGVNMDGCKPATRLLCRQDYSDFYKAKQNGRNIQNLKKFSMEKRGYETEQEYDRYAKRRLLTALKNKAVPAEEYINRELDIPIKDIIPQTVSDEIINGPRYKILYEDNKITGREPDIPIGTTALNEPIDTDRYD